MSRSYRRTPICGWSCAESEKRDKQLANRRLRRLVKGALATGGMIPEMHEVSQRCVFAKDGKQWFGDMLSKEMRK